VNPNSALTYINSKGKADTIIFEQEKPKYNKKKNRLVSLITIHTDQELDDHRGDNTSYLSKHAHNAKVGNNNKFSKKIDNASLFIDGMFTKWTRVEINNDTENGGILIQRLVSDKPNWGAAVGGAIGVIGSIGFLAGCELSTVGIATAGCVVGTASGIGLSMHEITNGSNSAGYGPKGEGDNLYLKNNKNTDITDIDTRFGTGNGVADVPFFISLYAEKDNGKKLILPLGLFTFDNPVVGNPKATFSPYNEAINDGIISKEKITPKSIYGDQKGKNEVDHTVSLDSKFISKAIFDSLDVEVTYFGDQDKPASGRTDWVKGWKLDFSGSVPDISNFDFLAPEINA